MFPLKYTNVNIYVNFGVRDREFDDPGRSLTINTKKRARKDDAIRYAY